MFLFNHPVSSQLKTLPNPGGFPCFYHWKDTHTYIILFLPILWRKGTTTICQQGKYMLLTCSATHVRTWIPIIIIIINTVTVFSNRLPSSSHFTGTLPSACMGLCTYQFSKRCFLLSHTLTKLYSLSPSLAKHLKRASCCPYQVFISHSSTLSIMASMLACGNTTQGCET